jgi:hypothetical protein
METDMEMSMEIDMVMDMVVDTTVDTLVDMMMDTMANTVDTAEQVVVTEVDMIDILEKVVVITAAKVTDIGGTHHSVPFDAGPSRCRHTLTMHV